MSNDWETGGELDITKKQRAPSPAQLRKIYKRKQAPVQPSDEYEPSFFCSFPKQTWGKIRIRPVRKRAISTSVEYTLVKDESFLKLEVYDEGVIQCRWNCSRDEDMYGEYARVRAWWYEWLNTERTFKRFRHPFTGDREYGWGPDFFGSIVFGFRWETTDIFFEDHWQPMGAHNKD